MRGKKIGLAGLQLLQQRDGLIGVAGIKQNQTFIREYGLGLRVQLLRFFNFLQRFREAAQMQQKRGVPVMRAHGIRVQFERAFELTLCAGNVPGPIKIYEREGTVRS